jgi:hypothetical protein
MFNMDKMWHFQSIQVYWDIGIELCVMFLQDGAIQNLLFSNKEEFDILISSAFMYDCVFGIAECANN